MAQGQSSVVAMPSGDIAVNSGTSFSGPIIAGMVASFWQALPNLTNARIVELVKESSSRYNNPNVQFGYGIPNFQLALNTALENNQFNSEGYAVYPNPVNEEVIFSFPSNNISREISIYNSLGQEILNCNASNQLQLISMQSCENGLYFYKIASGNDTFTGKLIKK
jgi:subtilisin family serine protease